MSVIIYLANTDPTEAAWAMVAKSIMARHGIMVRHVNHRCPSHGPTSCAPILRIGLEEARLDSCSTVTFVKADNGSISAIELIKGIHAARRGHVTIQAARSTSIYAFAFMSLPASVSSEIFDNARWNAKLAYANQKEIIESYGYKTTICLCDTAKHLNSATTFKDKPRAQSRHTSIALRQVSETNAFRRTI